ncbi:MAG: pseudouridine synthase [Betaproteobacteria bacterium]|nr:pseudouridine synthase [Betaproteobacteria bacterium]
MKNTLSANRLPSRNGVSPSRVVVPHGSWPTLLDFLSDRFPAVGTSVWAQRLSHGLVLSENGSRYTATQACPHGHAVYYYRETLQETALPDKAMVLFEDERLLVADKPHFMPVTPGGHYLHNSLLVQLKQLTGLESLSPLHRIDRETAGLVVFAKHQQDRHAYQALFRQQAVEKQYEAVAAFQPGLALPMVYRSRIVESDRFFLSQEVPGEPNSETHLTLLAQQGDLALYGLMPISGKRHQLRIHMNALGLPIVGDQFYPKLLRGPAEPEDFATPLHLLAKRIRFTDPMTNQLREWVSPRMWRQFNPD